MIERLIAAGEELAELDSSLRRLFTKVDFPGEWELASQYYNADQHPRAGAHNPEIIQAPYRESENLWRSPGWIHQHRAVLRMVKFTLAVAKFGQSSRTSPRSWITLKPVFWI